MDFNLKFNLCFPKTSVDFLEERSFEEKFREKSLLEPILEKRFVLGKLKALNPLKLIVKIMK